MKKIRLYDSEGNILLPSTDVGLVENCPMRKEGNSLVFGDKNSHDANLEIKSPGVIRINGKNVSFGGQKKLTIEGSVLLRDATTKNRSVYLEDYPVDVGKMYFNKFLGVVAPLTEPTTEYYIYPGFKIIQYYPDGFGSDKTTYYYFKYNADIGLVLETMDPNTQKFVPLGSKTIY